MKTTLFDKYEISYEIRKEEKVTYLGVVGKDITGAEIIASVPEEKAKEKLTETILLVDVVTGYDAEGKETIATAIINAEEEAEEAAKNLVIQATPSLQKVARELKAEEYKKAKEEENITIEAMQAIMRYVQGNEDEKYTHIKAYQETPELLAKALEMTGIYPGYKAGNGKVVYENIEKAKEIYQKENADLFGNEG